MVALGSPLRRYRGSAGVPVGTFKLNLNVSGLYNGSGVDPSELPYWVSKGITRFRIPIGPQNLQASTGSALTSATLTTLNTMLGVMAGLGAQALIDVHGFGTIIGGQIGGASGVPISTYADLITKLATWCKGGSGGTSYPGAIYGIDVMNEWHGMTDSGVQNDTATQNYQIAFNANQAAITAARNAGFTAVLVIEGNNYSTPVTWAINNANWYQLVDPLSNLVFHAHCYLDGDSSGTHFNWAEEVAAGAGLDGSTSNAVNVNIGVQRLTPFVQWCQAHGVRGGVGEFGFGNGYPCAGNANDNDDYADWNAAAKAALDYCQANAIEVFIWAAGVEFGPSYGGYEYNPAPTGIASPGSRDYTSVGFQSTQMVVLEKYTGYSGAQPSTYRLDLPRQISAKHRDGTYVSTNGTQIYNTTAGTETVSRYGASGAVFGPAGSGSVTSVPFKIRYNGTISAAVTITPHANFSDGTVAGGTFSPATITLPPGDNAVASFTYTPAASDTLLISTTNSAGWTDPPALSIASKTDSFAGLAATPRTVFGLRRLIAYYTGAAIRLQRGDGTQQAFSFNRRGDLPRQAIQDWAGSRSITLVTVYNQLGDGNDLTFSGSTLPTLNLVDTDGYPSIVVASGTLGGFNSVDDGQTGQTVIARLNETGGNAFIRQDWFTGPFSFSASAYALPDASTAGVTASVSLGKTAGWHTYGATAKANTTGGLRGFRDTTLVASADLGAVLFAPQFHNAGVNLGYFKFGGTDGSGNATPGAFWSGSFRSVVMLTDGITDGQENAFASDDATYYATALPDSLGALSSAPAETAYAAPSGTFTPVNFKGVNLDGATNNYPSSSGFDYVYPQDSDIAYYAGKGFGVVRMPVKMGGRLQLVPYGALDPAGRTDEVQPNGGFGATQLGEMKRVIDTARSNGMWVVIDPHDLSGGQYFDTSTGTGRTVGVDAAGTAMFVDWWTRIATKFKNYDNVIFGLLNEPIGQTAAQLKDAFGQAITAIRGTGATQLILIPGNNYSAAYSFVGNMGTAYAGWTPDPANNFAFEMHNYLDSDSSGSHTACAVNAYSRLTSATSWLQSNNVRGFLGEFGFSSDPTCLSGAPSEATKFMDVLSNGQSANVSSNSSGGWMGWTYWNGGTYYTQSGYMYALKPDSTDPGNAPQLAVLTAHF